MDKTDKLLVAHFKGFKVATLSNLDNYICIRTEDVQDFQTYIKAAKVELKRKENTSELTVHLLEEIIVFWSTNFHLKLLTLQREIYIFVDDIKSNYTVGSRASKWDRSLKWNFRMLGLFAYHIKISEDHDAKLAIGELLSLKYK